MIKVKSVTKIYGDNIVLDNINMDIDELLKIFKLNEETKLLDDVTFLMLKRKQN